MNPKKFFYLFLFFLGLLWAEVSLHKVFGPSYFIPWIVILMVTALATSRGLKTALPWCFIAGFGGEAFSGMPFGTFIIMCLAAAAISYFVMRNRAGQDVPAAAVMAIVGLETLLLPAAAFLFNMLISSLGPAGRPAFSDFFSWAMLWRFPVNVLMFFPINKLFRIFFDE